MLNFRDFIQVYVLTTNHHLSTLPFNFLSVHQTKKFSFLFGTTAVTAIVRSSMLADRPILVIALYFVSSIFLCFSLVINMTPIFFVKTKESHEVSLVTIN